MADEKSRNEDEDARPLTAAEYRHQTNLRGYEERLKQQAERAANIKSESGTTIAAKFREVHLLDDEAVISRAVDNLAGDLAQRRVTPAQLSPADMNRAMTVAATKAAALQNEQDPPLNREASETKGAFRADRGNANEAPIPPAPNSHGIERPTRHYAALAEGTERDTPAQIAVRMPRRAPELAGPDAPERQAAPPVVKKRSSQRNREESAEAIRRRKALADEKKRETAVKPKERDRFEGKEMTDARQSQLNRQADRVDGSVTRAATHRPVSGHFRGGR